MEFHLYSSDWITHRHHSDPRYNNVILHVVLLCNDLSPTMRQDGQIVPVCSLNDLPLQESLQHMSMLTHQKPTWPCQEVIAHLSEATRGRLLKHAGLLRFEQKAHAFVEQIRTTHPLASFDSYDVCLIPALAEGLGYGRDRDIFRAAGLYVLGQPQTIPEPLGHTAQPSPLDTKRLHTLRNLVEQWHTHGVWQTLRTLIEEGGCKGHSPLAWGLGRCPSRFSLLRRRRRPLVFPLCSMLYFF